MIAKKFLSWKDASNEPNCETFRLIVVEILDSKDNIADEHGSILKQNYRSSRFLKLNACFIHHNFCVDHLHRLTSKALPIQPFSSILDWFLLMKMSPKLRMMRLKWFFPYKLIKLEKSIGNCFKMIQLSALQHSWWSAPLDEKVSETEIDAIDLTFHYKRILGREIAWKRFQNGPT